MLLIMEEKSKSAQNIFSPLNGCPRDTQRLIRKEISMHDKTQPQGHVQNINFFSFFHIVENRI